MPSPVVRARLAFCALAVGTITVGLLVHLRGTGFSATARDILGDALWAMMIAWWIGALLAKMSVFARSLTALAICWAVEFSQAYHFRLLDSVRQTTIGQLVLGTGFDARDLLAYAIGVAAALGLELAVRAVALRRATIPSSPAS